MANIQAATATIAEDHSEAVPGVFIGAKEVIFHLTKGFSPTEQGHDASPAITANAKVQVSFSSPADEAAFDFRILQFMKVENVSFFYAGRKTSDGSISINAHIPPALADPILLDNLPGKSPFASPESFQKDGPFARNNFHDHPQFKVGQTLVHKLTQKDMFLFHAVDRRSFLTVFSAQDGAGKLQHLAFFVWKVEHNVKFQWRANKPSVASSSSSIEITQKPTNGAPNLPEFSAQLANPHGPDPDANTTMKKALLQAITSSAPLRTDNPRWFVNVPFNFFQ